MKFRVIDKKTGKEADTYEIALHEEWAQSLVYCDMEGFAITENGDLMLADECGNSVYCDPERFKVVFEEERPHGEWIPCSERLPKPDKYVLVCSDEGYIEVAEGFISTEIEEFVWLTSGWRFGTVIAWMPLPEPYKKER